MRSGTSFSTGRSVRRARDDRVEITLAEMRERRAGHDRKERAALLVDAAHDRPLDWLAVRPVADTCRGDVARVEIAWETHLAAEALAALALGSPASRVPRSAPCRAPSDSPCRAPRARRGTRLERGAPAWLRPWPDRAGWPPGRRRRDSRLRRPRAKRAVRMIAIHVTTRFMKSTT